MSQLLPEGIDHLGECPHTLHGAILGALRILQYEEFPIEERPPRRIWLDADRLKVWWEDVEAERKARYDSTSSSEDIEDDGDYPGSQNAVELITRG